MKKPLSLLALLALIGLAAGLNLAACNSSSVEPQAASDTGPSEEWRMMPQSAYETEILSLKAGLTDPEIREAAIRDAMLRYGFRPAETIHPEGTSQATSAAEATAMAKTAAFERVLRAKDFEFGHAWVHTKRVNVVNQAKLIAYTTRAADAQIVDPRIVAYYPDGPDNGRTPTHIVGLNDDYSGLDSRFSWINTTGSSRTVTIHVFAYSESSRGKANLNYRIMSPLGVEGVLRTSSGNLQATAVSANLPPRYACQDPADSQLGLRILSGGGYNAGLVAVNASLMRGGYLVEGLPPFVLGFVIPPGGDNFLLGIFEGDGGNAYEFSRYRALQDDFYPWCP